MSEKRPKSKAKFKERSKATGEPSIQPEFQFESKGVSDVAANPAVLLSSNFTIGQLFARGCLLPDSIEGKALVTEAAPTSLRWWRGKIPGQFVAQLTAAARNVIPIAIRLSRGRGVRHIKIAGTSTDLDCVAIGDADAIIFRDESERDRFLYQEFSNYSFSSAGIKVAVDPGAFGSEAAKASGPETPGRVPDATTKSGSPPSGGSALEPASEASSLLREAVRGADCRAGLLAYFLVGSPGKEGWIESVVRELTGKPVLGGAASLPQRIASAVLGRSTDISSSEDALLAAIVGVASRYPAEGGWPAARILREVSETAKAQLGRHQERERRQHELVTWESRAAQVLASKVEPQSMSDGEFVLQRAVLLLLLRGELEAIDASQGVIDSHLRPGPQVLGTASSLAAYRTGLRALPTRYKVGSDADAPERLLRFLGDAFIGFLQESSAGSLLPASLPAPSIRYRSTGELRGEWVTTVPTGEIARIAAEFDPAMVRLHAMGRHLGFSFDECSENVLVTQVSRGRDRRQPVRLSVIAGEPPSGPVVRFSSPAMRLSGSRSPSRVPRKLLVDLLKTNADPGIHCRFAISADESEVVVLADQLLSTLDEEEYRQHIQQVASVADGFAQPREPRP